MKHAFVVDRDVDPAVVAADGGLLKS